MFNRDIGVNTLNKQIIDEKAFYKLIENTYVGDGNDQKEIKKKTFSPSSLGGQGTCARYWKFAFSGTEGAYNFDGLGKSAMLNGIASHERIEKLFEEAGILESSEESVSFKYPPIFGYYDAIINFQGKRYLVDAKTVNSSKFLKVSSEHKPSPDHELQLLIYMKIKEIDDGLIYYENKDTHKIYIAPVVMNKRNRLRVERLFDWFEDVYEVAKGDEMPRRGFSPSTWQCKTCPFRDACSEFPNKRVGPKRAEL